MSAAEADNVVGTDADQLDYGDADAGAGVEGGDEYDADLAEIEAQLEESEETTNKIQEAAAQAGKSAEDLLREKQKQEEEKKERDDRSIFVKNVDWNTNAEELQTYFSTCGAVTRATIVVDKYGQPRGYAYVEFSSKDAVANAMVLDGTEFKGRKINVVQKRTNLPAFQLGRGGRGGRGGPGGAPPRGRGRGRGGPAGGMMMMMPAYMAAGGFGFGGMPYMPRGAWRGAGGRGSGGYRGRGAPRGRGGSPGS